MFDTMLPLFADTSLALIPHNMSFGLLWLFCYSVFLIVVYRVLERFLLPNIRFGYAITSIIVIQFCLSFLKLPAFFPVTLMALFLQSTISTLLMLFSPNVTGMSGKQIVHLLVVFGIIAQLLQVRARMRFKKENANKENNQQQGEGEAVADSPETSTQSNNGSGNDGFNDGPPNPNQSW